MLLIKQKLKIRKTLTKQLVYSNRIILKLFLSKKVFKITTTNVAVKSFIFKIPREPFQIKLCLFFDLNRVF